MTRRPAWRRAGAPGLAAAAALSVSVSATCAFGQTPQATPSATATPPPPTAAPPREIKVLIITMFEPEATPWIAPLSLTESIPVPGLLPEHPALRCNADDVCLLTAGMGHANVAASTTAVTLDPRFDWRRTYFLIAGIAGVDPAQGTLGSAAWARWLVDVGIAHQIDPREMPTGWRAAGRSGGSGNVVGAFGIMTKGPGIKPKLDYHTEVARLDEALLQKALALSRDAVLDDSAQARAYRARYVGPENAAARRPPAVVQCDTLGGDTWWHGHRWGRHARAWTRLLTDGAGTYCTTQQEDNATHNALARAAAAGRVDLKRLAVLRTASNFDRPYPGQSAYASLMLSTGGGTGGFGPATANLLRAGGPLVQDIVKNWRRWRDGVPGQ